MSNNKVYRYIIPKKGGQKINQVGVMEYFELSTKVQQTNNAY